MTRSHRLATGLRQATSGLAELRLQIAAGRLFEALLKFDPNQPRVPAGTPEGGQWTTTGGAARQSRVAGKWDPGKYDECEAQYERDILQCRMVPWNPFCVDQAISRRTACMKGDPIPDFFHVL